VLPSLEREHDVLAPALPGHAGGTPLPEPLTDTTLVEGIEAAMDEAGFDRAHIVGNSLGGHVALQLAQRGRAVSVVAFAPAGGWEEGDDAHLEAITHFDRVLDALPLALPYLETLLATRMGRRLATEYITERFDHIPVELIAHQAGGAAACSGARSLLALGRDRGWPVDLAAIDCPVRIVWGSSDRLLPWPRAAARFRARWLSDDDWVVLDGVGHCPQLDVPEVAAALILEFARKPSFAVGEEVGQAIGERRAAGAAPPSR
jgi:pimeloyl-ACP methyl ester carboxylesterase